MCQHSLCVNTNYVVEGGRAAQQAAARWARCGRGEPKRRASDCGAIFRRYDAAVKRRQEPQAALETGNKGAKVARPAATAVATPPTQPPTWVM